VELGGQEAALDACWAVGGDNPSMAVHLILLLVLLVGLDFTQVLSSQGEC